MGIQCASDTEQLNLLGIDHVLSVCDGDVSGIPEHMNWLQLSVSDSLNEDISRLFDPACDFIETARKTGGKILVHCVAGRSRSVSVLIVYLMRHRQMDLDGAFALIKKKRPFVMPNAGFWKQLQAEEANLFRLVPTTLPSQISRHGSPRSTAQLAKGSLSRAPQGLLEDFRRDLQKFSVIHHVTVQPSIGQDRIDVYFCPEDGRRNTPCLAELDEIFTFYRFRHVQWSHYPTCPNQDGEAAAQRW